MLVRRTPLENLHAVYQSSWLVKCKTPHQGLISKIDYNEIGQVMTKHLHKYLSVKQYFMAIKNLLE